VEQIVEQAIVLADAEGIDNNYVQTRPAPSELDVKRRRGLPAATLAGLPDQTFGVPTSLPWAVDLGDGIGRHPVQIYESLAMAAFFVTYVLALRVRAVWAMRHGFYWMAIVYGAQRFVWEFFKPYPTLIGPFNHFHLMCAALVFYGAAMIARDRRQVRPA